MKAQELVTQTREQHNAWLEDQAKQNKAHAYRFDQELSGMRKAEMVALCEEYGIGPSTPSKMRVALLNAEIRGWNEATNEMHKIWLRAN